MCEALDHKKRLELLRQERSTAIRAGVGADTPHMVELEAELAATLAAWINCAVMEIATARAQTHGPLNG
jgi:alkylhydroperoxidase family enzyme